MLARHVSERQLKQTFLNLLPERYLLSIRQQEDRRGVLEQQRQVNVY